MFASLSAIFIFAISERVFTVDGIKVRYKKSRIK
ncbi:hypothetical protein VIMY103929_15550 [Vibrio mytili]